MDGLVMILYPPSEFQLVMKGKKMSHEGRKEYVVLLCSFVNVKTEEKT